MPPKKRRGRQQSISFKAARFAKEDVVGGTIGDGGLRAGALGMGGGMDGSGAERPRYFVMGADSLEYFVSEAARTAAKPLGIVEFADVLRVVSLPDSPQSFAVQAQYRTYHLTASSVAERRQWAEAIEQAVDDYQEFKELAEAEDGDANQLIEGLEATLGVTATPEQVELLLKLRRNLADTQEKMMQTHQRAAIKAEEAEVFRDLQEIADDKLASLEAHEVTLSLLRKKVQKLENNTAGIRFVLETADEHVRDIQMLLQMPSFDQRALEAKEAEFAELLNQITQIMADCEVLANRSFSDEQLQAANPHANPQLREQIADMQRDVAAVRMQGAARGWLSKRAAEREAEAEAARIAAEPPWQEVAEERFARARVRIAETSIVLEADGSVTGAPPEPEPEPEPRGGQEHVGVDSEGGAVRLSFSSAGVGGGAVASLRSVLRPCSFPLGFVAPDSPTVEMVTEAAKNKRKAAAPAPGVTSMSMASMSDPGAGAEEEEEEEDGDVEMNPALMAMLGGGGGGSDEGSQPDTDDEDEDEGEGDGLQMNPALMMMLGGDSDGDGNDGAAAGSDEAEEEDDMSSSDGDEAGVEMNPALMAMLSGD